MHRTPGVMCGTGGPVKLFVPPHLQPKGSHAQTNKNKILGKMENAQPPQQQPPPQENRTPSPSKLDRQPGTTCDLDDSVKLPPPQKEPMGGPTPINPNQQQEQMANAPPPQQQPPPKENKTPVTTGADGKCTTPSATTASPGKQNTTDITDGQPGTTGDLDDPVKLPLPQKEPKGDTTPINPNQQQEQMANAPPPQLQLPPKENRTPLTTGVDDKCTIPSATAASPGKQNTTVVTDRQPGTCDLDGPVKLPLPQKEPVGDHTPTNPNQPLGQMANAPPPQQQPSPAQPQYPAYPYPVGTYNGPTQISQLQQQPVGGSPMPAEWCMATTHAQ